MSAETDNSEVGQRRLPGEMGLWIFILSDLMLFGLYFALFSYDLTVDPESFYHGQASLDRNIGLFNTLLLLTGSWAVAMGTRVEQDPSRAANYLSAAALTGAIFLGMKAIEYSHLIGGGHYLTESRFFIWYFFLSGYHAIHVVAGSIFLQYVSGRMRRRQPSSEALVESAGCYWHLVDLLWIGIFTIAYLI